MKLKISNKRDARGTFSCVSLFGWLSANGFGRAGLEVARSGAQQIPPGAQGSAGRGFGSCNHMETEKKRFFLKILAERQVTGWVWKSDGLDRSVPNWKFLRFHRTA